MFFETEIINNKVIFTILIKYDSKIKNIVFYYIIIMLIILFDSQIKIIILIQH